MLYKIKAKCCENHIHTYLHAKSTTEKYDKSTIANLLIQIS